MTVPLLPHTGLVDVHDTSDEAVSIAPGPGVRPTIVPPCPAGRQAPTLAVEGAFGHVADVLRARGDRKEPQHQQSEQYSRSHSLSFRQDLEGVVTLHTYSS